MGFELAHPLPPINRPRTVSEVWAAVMCIIPCIELAGSRFGQQFGATEYEVLADAASAAGVVQGRGIYLDRDNYMANCEAVLYVNGKSVDSGDQRRCPLLSAICSLHHVANHLNARGITLNERQIVLGGRAQPCLPPLLR